MKFDLESLTQLANITLVNLSFLIDVLFKFGYAFIFILLIFQRNTYEF